MRPITRFIPGEDIDAVSRWTFSDVDAAAMLLEQQSREHELNEQIASVRQQFHAEGYADGFKQGRAQTLLEAQKQISDYIAGQGREAAEQFGRLVESVSKQLEAAEQMAGQAVLELACEMARQVLRHEISSNPNVLLPVIREALGLLFTDSKAVQIRLNPLDLDVLQDILSEEYPNLPLTLQPDASITRGGCLVESGGTVIDGRLEKRWARTVGRLGQNLAWEGVSGDDA
ncbi:MAG: flagellar assembly protein FliH [Burkholderiales bacterium]|nr:flagellar assembly protein FliH [Burkholderiales bacterium]